MAEADKKTGTREWSDVSINCSSGCTHGCLYCYARFVARQYGRLKVGGDWRLEKPKDVDAIRRDPQYRRRYPGVVMFPTTHDITPETAEACLETLRILLRAGNSVLLVTKPHMELADRIASVVYDAWRSDADARVEIRCTIGALDEAIARDWEPFAPAPSDRIQCLKFFRLQGLPTSVSMEPLLDPASAREIVSAVAEHVSHTIWVGKMNQLSARLKWFFNECQDVDRLVRLRARIQTLEFWQSDARVMSVVDALSHHPAGAKIRWKDSYQEVITRLSPP